MLVRIFDVNPAETVVKSIPIIGPFITPAQAGAQRAVSTSRVSACETLLSLGNFGAAEAGVPAYAGMTTDWKACGSTS